MRAHIWLAEFTLATKREWIAQPSGSQNGFSSWGWENSEKVGLRVGFN
jgi:hypothetical protein